MRTLLHSDIPLHDDKYCCPTCGEQVAKDNANQYNCLRQDEFYGCWFGQEPMLTEDFLKERLRCRQYELSNLEQHCRDIEAKMAAISNQ